MAVDPYPGFELSRLNFSLDDISALPSYQLALVNGASRRIAAQTRGDEVGLDELQAQRKALEKAKAALEEASRERRARMKDCAVQTGSGEPVQAVKLEHGQQPRLDPTDAGAVAGPSSTAAQSPPPQVDLAPPGPNFDFDYLAKGAVCPPSLHAKLNIVRLACNDPSRVTPRLIHAYLLARRRDPFPRPLAIKKATNGSGAIMLGFASAADADSVRQRLDSVTLPLARVSLVASLISNNGSVFRWGSLSREVQDEWTRSALLPSARWVALEDPPRRGVSVSKAYATEWGFIDADLRREEENQRRLDEEDRRRGEEEDARRRWTPPALYDGRGDSEVPRCYECGRDPLADVGRCDDCCNRTLLLLAAKRARYH